MIAPRSGITHCNDSQGFFEAGRLGTLVWTSVTMLLGQENVVNGASRGNQLAGWEDLQSSFDNLTMPEAKLRQRATELFTTDGPARHGRRVELHDQLQSSVSLTQLPHAFKRG